MTKINFYKIINNIKAMEFDIKDENKNDVVQNNNAKLLIHYWFIHSNTNFLKNNDFLTYIQNNHFTTHNDNNGDISSNDDISSDSNDDMNDYIHDMNYYNYYIDEKLSQIMALHPNILIIFNTIFTKQEKYQYEYQKFKTLIITSKYLNISISSNLWTMFCPNSLKQINSVYSKMDKYDETQEKPHLDLIFQSNIQKFNNILNQIIKYYDPKRNDAIKDFNKLYNLFIKGANICHLIAEEFEDSTRKLYDCIKQYIETDSNLETQCKKQYLAVLKHIREGRKFYVKYTNISLKQNLLNRNKLYNNYSITFISLMLFIIESDDPSIQKIIQSMPKDKQQDIIKIKN